MSPEAALFLENEVYPIIKGTVPRTVRPVDGEDTAELVQDAVVSAARMLDSAERQGKIPPAKSLAYYSIKRAKTGRRSYSCKPSDLLSSERRISHPGVLLSLDAEITLGGEGGDTVSFSDAVADKESDPSEHVSKLLDWEALMSKLGERERFVLCGTGEGFQPSELAEKLKVSRSRITQIKREIGDVIKAFMGKDVLNDAAQEPLWQRELRCLHENKGWQLWEFKNPEDIYA
ncbi:MAG: hypothetical protein A2020_05845 [Lentisphaerae bacterium GWF2_45_14]|nr:MAG: hypothetical protein A2020_05845 [Lentisphaerae bacterium GWF2_45_14]